MRLIKAADGEPYEAKNHHGANCVRKVFDTEGAGNLSVSVSEFEPGGGTDLCASVKDRAYYILEGRIEVETETGEVFQMDPGDMLFVPAGEKRGYQVLGNSPCRMIVMIVKAQESV